MRDQAQFADLLVPASYSVPALFACFLFAFTDAVQLRHQGTPLPLIGTVPSRRSRRSPTRRPCCCSPASSAARSPPSHRRALCDGAVTLDGCAHAVEIRERALRPGMNCATSYPSRSVFVLNQSSRSG